MTSPAKITNLTWHQHRAIHEAIEARPMLVPPSLLLTKTTLSWDDSDSPLLVRLVEQAIAANRVDGSRGYSNAIGSVARKLEKLGLQINRRAQHHPPIPNPFREPAQPSLTPDPTV